MIKTIVVPLDGSRTAEAALEPARALAAGFDADLLLITSTLHTDLAAEDHYLHQVIGRRGLQRASAEVASGRSAGPAIVHAASSVPDPVVCMATHGRTGWREAILGSVAEEIVRTVDAPTMLVGPKWERASLDGELVVCWDGSVTSARAVPVAASWGRTLGKPVRLLTVGSVESGASGPGVPTVEMMLAQFSIGGVGVEHIHLDDVGDPAGSILAHVSFNPVGLIVAATQGSGGLLGSALGSVVGRLVSASPCPVVVVPAHRPGS
jgi:nucleotide-binding universal stress UspA family protein